MTWNGDEYKGSSKSQIKEQIFKAIQESEDKNLKTVLALMYGSLEYTDEAIQRIEAKLDALRHDESAIKKLVLNGYDSKHHEHHDWLDRRINNDEYMKNLINRAEPILVWAEKFQAEQEQMKPVCDWAKNAMSEQQALKEDKKTLVMRFLGGAFNQFGTVVATTLVAWIMWGPK